MPNNHKYSTTNCSKLYLSVIGESPEAITVLQARYELLDLYVLGEHRNCDRGRALDDLLAKEDTAWMLSRKILSTPVPVAADVLAAAAQAKSLLGEGDIAVGSKVVVRGPHSMWESTISRETSLLWITEEGERFRKLDLSLVEVNAGRGNRCMEPQVHITTVDDIHMYRQNMLQLRAMRDCHAALKRIRVSAALDGKRVMREGKEVPDFVSLLEKIDKICLQLSNG